MIRGEYKSMLVDRRLAISEEFRHAAFASGGSVGGMCVLTEGGAAGLDPVKALCRRLGIEGMVEEKGGIQRVLEVIAQAEPPPGWSPRERRRTELMREAAADSLRRLAVARKKA